MSAGREPYDVVVVGAGIVGSYLASRLAERGRRVALVECGPADLSGGAEPSPPIACTARDHEGMRLARHHVVGGNSAFWGGGLIRNRPGEVEGLLDDLAAPTDALDDHYSTVERVIGLPHAPARIAGADGIPDGFEASEILVLPGRARNIARARIDHGSRQSGFRLLAQRETETLIPPRDAAPGALVVRDRDGGREELSARDIVVCAGAADSVLFFQRFAGALGIDDHPLLGTRLHDHHSVPLFEVRGAGRSAFAGEYLPRFVGGFVSGRRLELEVECSDGWRPSGFLHFQCEFDEASPYRELKALLDLRQRGGSAAQYLRVLAGAAGALPSTLRVGFDRYVRGRLYVSPRVRVVATFDFESFPSPRNRLVLERDAGAERAAFDWDLRDEDVDAFRKFFPQLRQAMETLARRFSLAFDPVPSLAGARSPEDHLRASVHDAYHLGGGVQSGRSPADGILRPDLRLHSGGRVHAVSTAAFRRPGIGNPVHSLLALAERLTPRLTG